MFRLEGMCKIRAQRLHRGEGGGGGRGEGGGKSYNENPFLLYMESCHSIITMYGENIKGVCPPRTSMFSA